MAGSIACGLLAGGAVYLIIALAGGADGAEGTEAAAAQDQAPQVHARQPGQQGPARPAAPAPTSPPSGLAVPERPVPPGDDRAALDELTRHVIEVLESRDTARFAEVRCDRTPGLQSRADDIPADLTWSRNGEPEIEGDTAEIPLKATRAATGQVQETSYLATDDPDYGGWCISG